MSNPSVFDTQYVLVVQATDGDGQPVLLAEGSKYGGTIWTGLRGQGGATAVARRAAEDIEEDLLAGGWTDVAVHVLPVNANEEIDAGFPRPESKEERERHQRQLQAQAVVEAFIGRERGLVVSPWTGILTNEASASVALDGETQSLD